VICAKHDVFFPEGSECWCCVLQARKAEEERIKGPDDTLAELAGRVPPIASVAGQTAGNPTATTGGLTPRTSWPAWMLGDLAAKKD